MKNFILLLIVASITLTAAGQNQVANLKLSDWPKDHREAVEKMIKKYGQPDEATASMVKWNNKGPWKKIIIYKEEWDHKFPKAHKDFVEQYIDYKAPVEKYDDIAKYDGSVTVIRTPGEMAARCDKEEMNFLALNLANEVATGKRTVDDAREFYAKTAMEFMSGNSSPYIEKLLFTVSKGNTGDPDENMPMKALSKEEKRKQ
ncbi:MAG: hypothetical protein ACOYXT_25695 [Bacteroidota bacterium]